MADYLEGAYFTGILHMGTDAGASIIIPYPHDTEGLGGVRRKFAQVNNVSRLFTIHELDGDIVMPGNLLIDLGFNLSDLLRCRLRFEDIVALGFLLLYMSIP